MSAFSSFSFIVGGILLQNSYLILLRCGVPVRTLAKFKILAYFPDKKRFGVVNANEFPKEEKERIFSYPDTHDTLGFITYPDPHIKKDLKGNVEMFDCPECGDQTLHFIQSGLWD